MLLLLSIGDTDGLAKLAVTAEQKGQNNLAFAALLQVGNPAACVDLLVKTQRAPEAAMFARTYAPSKVPDAVQAWRGELTSKNRSKLAASIADPIENEDLFEEGWKDAVARETGAATQQSSLPVNSASFALVGIHLLMLISQQQRRQILWMLRMAKTSSMHRIVL